MFVFICTEVNARWFGFTTGGEIGGYDSRMVSSGKHKLSLVPAGEFIQENINIQYQTETKLIELFGISSGTIRPLEKYQNYQVQTGVDECWIFSFRNN